MYTHQQVEGNGGACCSLDNMGEGRGDIYYHGNLRCVVEEPDKEEIPADVHAMDLAMSLGGQSASKSAAAICLQDVARVFLDIPLVHPSLPAFACEVHLGKRIEWREE